MGTFGMIIFGAEVKGDHTFTRESVERYIEQAYRAGQEDERAKIVAWLREPGWERTFELDAITKDIEAGDHLT